jgi:hypothetical protein
VLAEQTQCAAASQRQAAQLNAVGVYPWLFAGASEAIFLPKRLNPDLPGFEDFQDDYPVNPIIGGIGVQTKGILPQGFHCFQRQLSSPQYPDLFTRKVCYPNHFSNGIPLRKHIPGSSFQANSFTNSLAFFPAYANTFLPCVSQSVHMVAVMLHITFVVHKLLRVKIRNSRLLSEPRLARIKRFSGYVEMMLRNPANPLNKYNRTLGKEFVDGRFYVFAVIGGIGVQTKGKL